jgi:(p)ppGpp synthase/HD superfamily hydrolase
MNPAQLRSMPLRAVTEMYGEEGLRERLVLELDRLPAAERSIVEEAARWAVDLHAGQRRTREPYLNHVLRVAIRILAYYRVTDVDVVVAALLHDAVEDQPWRMIGREPDDGPPPHQEALTVLAERFGPRTARLVKALTNPIYDPDRDADEQYREHVRDALTAEPWARVVKLSDFTDNGVGVLYAVGPKVERAARKYTPLVPVMRDFVARDDTPLDPDVKQRISRQLDLAASRFAAILGSHARRRAPRKPGVPPIAGR